MKQLLDRIPAFFKSFYFLSTVFFLFWLAFIDSNNLFLQQELKSKQYDLEKDKNFYEDRIMEVKNDRAALTNNSSLLEKVAREKYLMKKENEDLYIIVD